MAVLSKFKLATTEQSSSLIIVFQSMNSFLYKHENLSRFELENTFDRLSLDADLLFIKDPSPHLFYLECFQEIKNLVLSVARMYSYVVFTGISAGGWASLLYGSIAKANLVVAINPMTTLVEQGGGESCDITQ